MATLINVCGTERSGSTLIDVVLGNGEDAFSCGEVYAAFRPFMPHHFVLDCPCGSHPCPIWSKIGNVKPNNFHLNASKQLEREFIIDSSKDLAWMYDSTLWALNNGMKVYNVVTWKDPIAFAYSSWKRGRDHLWWRNPFVAYYNYLFSTGMPFIAVSIDKFLADPEGYLECLCKKIGMKYFCGKSHFWELQKHQLFGSPSVRDVTIQGHGKIKAAKKFPDDFNEVIAECRDYLARDLDVSTVVNILLKHDLETIDLEHVSLKHFIRPHLSNRPLWYYRLRFEKLWHRFVNARTAR